VTERVKDFMDIVQGITVGDGKWKPFQSGLLLCTQTALDLQIEYLEKEKFYFLIFKLRSYYVYIKF